MTNEGNRREVVNNAQLYGLSVKRFQEPPERFELDKKPNETTSVEFYIESMVYIKHRGIRMVLTFFENNQAKLFDLRGFQKIQDLTFPSNMAEERDKLKAKAARIAEQDSVKRKENAKH